MTTIAQWQAQVAQDQADLQSANNFVTEAQTNLQQQITAGATPAEIAACQAEVAHAQDVVQQYTGILQADQASLDQAVNAAQADQQPIPPTPPDVAPADSEAPQMTDPQNDETVTDYSTPTTSQLTMEATLKVSSTGLTSSLTAITSAVSIVVGNGSASAVN